MALVEEKKIKDESCSDDDRKLVIKEEQDEMLNANISQTSTASSCDYSLSQFSKNEPKFEADDDVDDNEDESRDENALQIKQEDEDSDEDMPLVRYLTIFCVFVLSV